jgi:hypothetical protein
MKALMLRYCIPEQKFEVGATIVRLCVFLFFLCAISGIAKGSPDEKLIEELSDRENVLVHIDAETLSRRLTVPESDIDLSIDRRQFLHDLVEHIAPQSNESERVGAWVRYLQDRIAHPAWPPMHNAATMVLDPIWILEHRLGQCGQTNRVLVDGLLAVGMQARVVQLAAHVAAEAWYDGQWHYLDADWLNLGQMIRRPDGVVPSTAEIYEHPEFLKGLNANREFELYPINVIHTETYKPYQEMFKRVRLGEYETPYYLIKTATPAQERNIYFGWDRYRVESK